MAKKRVNIRPDPPLIDQKEYEKGPLSGSTTITEAGRKFFAKKKKKKKVEAVGNKGPTGNKTKPGTGPYPKGKPDETEKRQRYEAARFKLQAREHTMKKHQQKR